MIAVKGPVQTSQRSTALHKLTCMLCIHPIEAARDQYFGNAMDS